MNFSTVNSVSMIGHADSVKSFVSKQGNVWYSIRLRVFRDLQDMEAGCLWMPVTFFSQSFNGNEGDWLHVQGYLQRYKGRDGTYHTGVGASKIVNLSHLAQTKVDTQQQSSTTEQEIQELKEEIGVIE